MGNVTSSSNTLDVFNTNVANSLAENLTTIAQSGSQQASGSQVLNIGDINACPGGDIIISGITQTNISTFEFKQLADASNSQDMQNALKSAITAACEQNQKVANELGAIGNVSLTDQSQTVFSENVSNIAAKVSTNEIQSISQSQNNDQTLNILKLNTTCSPIYGSGNVQSGGDITISDINQTIRMDLVASQTAQLVSEQVVKALGDASVDAFSSTSQDVTNTGLASLISAWFSGITGIIVTIIIVLALLIAIIVVPIVVLKRKAKKKAAALLGAPGAAKASVATTGPEEAVIKEGMGSTQQQAAPQTGGGMGSTLQRLASSPQAKQLVEKGFSSLGKMF